MTAPLFAGSPALRTAAVAAVAVVLVLAACAGPGASPGASPLEAATPAASPTSPASSPGTSPATVAWRWQVPLGPRVTIGPDGTIYATGRGPACDVEIHALRPDGSERADGWPYCVAGATYGPDGLAVDGTGTVYVSHYGAGPGSIVGLAPDGTPGPGWPAPFGTLVGTLEAGVVVLTPSPSGPNELRAYDPTGRALPGWPVTAPGPIVEPAFVGPGDTVAVLYRDLSTGHRWVTVIERDGSVCPGWPVAVPNDMDGRSVVIDLVTTDGRVVLRSHEPWPAEGIAPEGAIAAMGGLRAQVAVIEPDGTIPGDWPVRFEQPLSQLVEGPGGRVYAVAGDVQYGPNPETRAPAGPYFVVSLEPDGVASPGWPARLPDGAMPQPAEETPGPVPPWALPPVVGADGSAVVITRGDGTEGLAWFDRDGTLATVFQLPGSTSQSNGVPATPGGPAQLPVILGDRAFLAVGIEQPGASAGDPDRRGSDAPWVDRPIPALTADTSGGAQEEGDGILAVERTGAVAGWPVLLPRGTFVSDMLVADGMLVVVGSTGEDAGVLAAVDPTAIGGE